MLVVWIDYGIQWGNDNRHSSCIGATIRRGQASLRVLFSTTVYPQVWDASSVDLILTTISERICLAPARITILNTGRCAPGSHRGQEKSKSRSWKEKPRRIVTTKLAPDALCKFYIRLVLYKVEYWCIEPWTGNRDHRKHPPLDWEETRRPIASLPVLDSDNAALYSRFTSTGSARSILFQQTKCTLSD